jgi:protein TonB
VSAILHAVGLALLIAAKPATPAPPPPVYRVHLRAAPAGPRASGVVEPAKAATTPKPTPPKATPRPAPSSTQRTPQRQTTRATPTPPKAATPQDRAPEQAKAAGGAAGGKGSDVVNVDLDGLEFPFQPYLDNIVRQISLQFPKSWPAALTAEVSFLIDRTGGVKGLRITRRSGSYEFDAEAQAAIESVGRSKAFGPLPTGFAGDVLPVVFLFDPKILR